MPKTIQNININVKRNFKGRATVLWKVQIHGTGKKSEPPAARGRFLKKLPPGPPQKLFIIFIASG
jgi:hypothetical protein